MTSVVLDASALIALLRSEPGAEVVRKLLAGAVISAVNYSEVLKKTIERGGPVEVAVSRIDALSLSIIPFDERHAAAAAELYPQAKPHGLSFADRACIALGLEQRATVLTTDGKWKLLKIPLKLELIRNDYEPAKDEKHRGGDLGPGSLPPAVISPSNSASPVSVIKALAEIPEEEIWLAKQKSRRTRRAYKQDVQHFMRTLEIRSYDELRQMDHRAVIAWERIMRDTEKAAASTIRRRLAALSSLFKHLTRHGHLSKNHVAEVERPNINREEGTTLAFSKAQANKLLNSPAFDTVDGLRDRAILSVGLQVGLRRAEIAALSVGDLHQNRGYDSLRVARKGGRRDALAIHPQTAQRIRAYLEKAGHSDDIDGPLFRPLQRNRKRQEERRYMDPDVIDRIVRKYSAKMGLDRGYSAHSMRATFITTALENGAQLEDVQKAAGHRDPSTTKLYDRRGYNPEKAASFFATY